MPEETKSLTKLTRGRVGLLIVVGYLITAIYLSIFVDRMWGTYLIVYPILGAIILGWIYGGLLIFWILWNQLG